MPTNRLIHEKSPYLLQHAHNPVDWCPWGTEAFARRAGTNRPVFLSIGYSTCHWCHVMERESFEDEEVAALLNERFVPVKVDREERPDVDQVYMRACQALTGRGGWPLTLLLDAEGRPFYAATYLPKRSHGVHPGFSTSWPHRRASGASGPTMWRGRPPASWKPSERRPVGERAGGRRAGARGLRGGGGGAGAPASTKSTGGSAPPRSSRPPTSSPSCFARHRRTGDARALAHGLRHARRHAGRRHLGPPGGRVPPLLHRRALARPPLRENALRPGGARRRVRRGVPGHRARPLRGHGARDLEYVLRDLSDPDGGFHCGEDADSEGEEGRFYLWTTGEVSRILGETTGAAFAARYGMTGEGNYHDEATGEATGRNILAHPPARRRRGRLGGGGALGRRAREAPGAQKRADTPPARRQGARRGGRDSWPPPSPAPGRRWATPPWRSAAGWPSTSWTESWGAAEASCAATGTGRPPFPPSRRTTPSSRGGGSISTGRPSTVPTSAAPSRSPMRSGSASPRRMGRSTRRPTTRKRWSGAPGRRPTAPCPRPAPSRWRSSRGSIC